jgi:glycosyltransferase involved in cell wall biosynthesis
MKISVLIPAYNAARTIEATLASVFRQTIQPDEIIVLLDGGTDDTLNRLERFKDRITIVRQENHGPGFTRNRLVEMAKGDLFAFMDSDDLWHPKYLEVQRTAMRDYPDALVSFTGHVTFAGADYVWKEEPATDRANAQWINQMEFFKQYNATTGQFGSMSFACVRKSAFKSLGPEPFQFSPADDYYLFNELSLLGGVIFFKSPLVAYRVLEGSVSANRLKAWPQVVNALAKLEPEFKKSGIRGLRQAFPKAYAGSRRYYAKMLLGVGRYGEARYQLLQSMAICRQPGSFAKSFGIWAASWLPVFLQPKWPSYTREIGGVVAPPPSPSPAVGRAKS